MKIWPLTFVVFMLGLPLAGCDTRQSESTATESHLLTAGTTLLFEKKNASVGQTASFYGVNLDPSLNPKQVIEYIILKDDKSGNSVKYMAKSETAQAADFYFIDIWSPDGTYLILPIGKLEGFGIFKARTAIADIKAKKYTDTLVVWKYEARRYWHTFDAWNGPATFRFKGEMEGDTFQFAYDITTRQLSCFDPGCAADDSARNLKGNITLQEKVK
jgi:hypothetical protein